MQNRKNERRLEVIPSTSKPPDLFQTLPSPLRKANNEGNVSLTGSCHYCSQNNSVGSLKIQEWLTTEEAATYLGLTVGALRNMASNGQVPYHKLGRRNRYLLVELRQLLLSNKRGVSYVD